MRRPSRSRPSRVRSLVTAVAVLGCLVAPTAALSAPSSGTTTVTRVEEDWEVYLSVPKGEKGSPQVVLVTAPDPNSRFRCLFLVNHLDTPDFIAGGAQLQIWDGDVLAARYSFAAETLEIPEEKIRLTVYMQRANGKLTFGLSKVASPSWGTLSPPGFDCSATDPTASFPAYSTSVAAAETAIPFGSNRVHSLKVLAVRKYAGTKLVATEAGATVYVAPVQ